MLSAKVIAPVAINGEPAKVGDIVEVDAATLENLMRKGRLAAVALKADDAEAESEPAPGPELKTDAPHADPKAKGPKLNKR